MIPLKLRWSALWSAYLYNDAEFLDLAQRSGVLHVNLGIESIDAETLHGMNKRFNKVSEYAQMFANLRRRGISYSQNFILGWDTEDGSVFRSTLEFLERHGANVTLPIPRKHEKVNWYLYTISSKIRDKISAELNTNDIGSTVYYGTPVHKTPYYNQKTKLPNTEWAANNVLSLPVQPLVSRKHLETTARIIRKLA